MKFLIIAGVGWAVIAFIKFMMTAIRSAGEGGNFSKGERIAMQHGFKGRVRIRMETLDDG